MSLQRNFTFTLPVCLSVHQTVALICVAGSNYIMLFMMCYVTRCLVVRGLPLSLSVVKGNLKGRRKGA